MKMIPHNILRTFFFLAILVLYSCLIGADSEQDTWIRINQLGYPPKFTKIAVWVSKSDKNISEFSIHDYYSKEQVWKSEDLYMTGSYGPFTNSYRLDFSSFRKPGIYYLSAGGANSGKFHISKDVYDGTADYLLNYMRQQRCGFNPFLKDSCHMQDGYTIYGPMPDGTRVDVTGGWHDASDYLQYLTTSATATINLLLAYRDFPFSFQDKFDASGLSGSNGKPDISDEATWGLQWLEKMNPDNSVMFNQIADDRDHQGFRLPTKDSVKYGDHPGRPVYYCTGDPQGLYKYKNRSTGLASTAGKYASTFALAAKIYSSKEIFYKKKSIAAYEIGLKHPGVCQTAPGRAEYFYEEDNWADDMELAAAELWQLTGNRKYLDDVYQFATQEPVTPWMGADTARHYQWYPFINWGHNEAASSNNIDKNKQLLSYYKEGLERIWQRGKNNAFRMGVPFIWCSNNLVLQWQHKHFYTEPYPATQAILKWKPH